MLTAHILKQRECLPDQPQRTLHRTLARALIGGALCFKERTHGLCEVLSNSQNILRDIRVFLERSERASQGLACAFGGGSA